jgi:CMP-N-acetylneuraminic acid synthetase
MKHSQERPFAIVPCRMGSKGIVNKNTTLLNGVAPVVRACRIAKEAGCRVVVTSDAYVRDQMDWGCNADVYLHAPAPLHQDETPMVDVIRDVLARIVGPEDEIVVLLQATQPLREPKHVQAAIALLEESKADSVVSVVELPRTHHPLMQFGIDCVRGELVPWGGSWSTLAPTRQSLGQTFTRDGTCYAFRRSTVTMHGNIYGSMVVPLIIDPRETCSLDSMTDWQEAERRLKERDHAGR